jgi:hypothetical protein
MVLQEDLFGCLASQFSVIDLLPTLFMASLFSDHVHVLWMFFDPLQVMPVQNTTKVIDSYYQLGLGLYTSIAL